MKDTTKRIFFPALGVIAVIVVLLILPTPLHDWFVSDSIGPVPADVGMMALVILFTPVTILSMILRNFDTDYEDEIDNGHSGMAPHLPA